MLDRATFIRPFAHRGLHNTKQRRIENTASAFKAAIAKGYGIECDLRPAVGGLPVVFHDLTIERLVKGKGRVSDLFAGDLKRLAYKGSDDTILTFAELLDLVDGDVPLLVEIKSEWAPPDRDFLSRIAKLATSYKGPIALMSFDPDVMGVIRHIAPQVPRGIVSGSYKGAGWWNRKITRARAAELRELLLSGPVAPHFYAYEVAALPTPVTRFVRQVLDLPLFTWTVRTANDRAVAAEHADAPIFERFEP